MLAAPVRGFPLGLHVGLGRRPLRRRHRRRRAARTIGLLYLFVKVVYLPLPKGDGFFEAVTLALYRLLHIF